MDGVNDICDTLVAAQSIMSAKHFDSVEDDVTDIFDALVAAQSRNEDSVTWS